MTGNVVITEVDVLMYVVLSGAEKHVTYEELVGITKVQRYSRGVAKTEVDILMYVVLSRAEKHVTYKELVGTTKVQRYSRGVAKTEVVINEFNCI